jgi:hypothetical protein
VPGAEVLRQQRLAGGLMSYGPSIVGLFRRAAEYADRIARGAKAADLPIEQPSKFDLVINLKTAKARPRERKRERDKRDGHPKG